MTLERAWTIEQQGFDPFREREMESIFCQGNGTLGSRGFSIPMLPSSHADLMIAGVYERKLISRPYSEPEFLTEDPRGGLLSELVSFPSPFRLGLKVEGRDIFAGSVETAQHERALDLRNGALIQRFVFQLDSLRRVSVRSSRCISLKDPHLLLQEIQFFETRESLSVLGSVGEVTRIEIDFSVMDQDFQLKYPNLKRAFDEYFENHPQLGKLQRCAFLTPHSGCRIDVVSQSKVMSQSQSNLREIGALNSPFNLSPSEILKIRRWIWVINRSGLEAQLDLKDWDQERFKEVRDNEDYFDQQWIESDHEWKKFWKSSDIRFEGAPELEQFQRFNLYQLRIAADSPSSEPSSPPCYSIPARGLSGRAYEGHIFWDADVFVAPFFVFNEPQIARGMLCYRHQTLNGAKKRAEKMGYSGACFAWESTLTGEDVTPSEISLKSAGVKIPIFTGSQQIHITADVAYSVWNYWEMTRDLEFFEKAGIEILIETARFWASRVEELEGRFHIRRVVGPDEYHHDVDDNAYTNWMARFNLEKAAWAVETFRKPPDSLNELATSLLDESVRWRDIANQMYFPMRPDGVIEQFAGFFNLQTVELKKEELFTPPVERLFEWQKVNQLQVIKQADVLMIFYLFPDAFESKVIEANYRYYEPVTDHGSSLSPPVYAAIAAQIGRLEDAENYWRRSILLDLKNFMNNTSLGIHVGCMGATWQTLVFHLLGIRMGESGPILPDRVWQRLPRGCDAIRLNLKFRGIEFPIEISRRE